MKEFTNELLRIDDKNYISFNETIQKNQMIDLSNLLPYDSENSCSYELIMWRTSLAPLGVFVLFLWPPQMSIMPVVAGGMRNSLKLSPSINGAN